MFGKTNTTYYRAAWVVYCTFHGFDKRAELLFFFLICLQDDDEDDDIEDDNDVCL